MLPAGRYLRRSRRRADIAPDFVIFDGGANDAQSIFRDRAYTIRTYAAELEKTLHTMRRKWPTAPIVYVAAHKLGSRDWDTQVALREVTLETCHKWGIAIADIFGETAFDTRDDAQRAKYTFDDLVDGFPGTEGSGTHPNMAGITTFYVPLVSDRLQQISPR